MPTCTRRPPANSALFISQVPRFCCEFPFPKQKRETRTPCHRNSRSARSCVWSLFFSLSQWYTPRRRRRDGARSVLRVRELLRCCACILHCGVVCSHCNGCLTQRASVQRHSFSLPRTQRTGLRTCGREKHAPQHAGHVRRAAAAVQRVGPVNNCVVSSFTRERVPK